MSTYVYLACLDHEPPLLAIDESDQHRHSDGVMDGIRSWVDQRDLLVPMWEQGQLNYDDYFLAHTMRFLTQHPKCRIAANTENGEWIDMGYGLPTHPAPTGEGETDERNAR